MTPGCNTPGNGPADTLSYRTTSFRGSSKSIPNFEGAGMPLAAKFEHSAESDEDAAKRQFHDSKFDQPLADLPYQQRTVKLPAKSRGSNSTLEPAVSAHGSSAK